MNTSSMNTRKTVDKTELRTITTYQAGIVQAAMHRTLQKVCDEILQPFGITKMQWLIIGATLDAGKKGARISDLAKELGTTIAYLTISVNLLESKGILVKRSNNQDSRSKLVTLDPSFAPQCREIEKVLREGLRQSIYAHVSPEDFQIYMKVLYQLKDVV